MRYELLSPKLSAASVVQVIYELVCLLNRCKRRAAAFLEGLSNGCSRLVLFSGISCGPGSSRLLRGCYGLTLAYVELSDHVFLDLLS